MILEIQNSLIIGSILGDGHLVKRKDSYNTSLQIKRSLADILYLENQFKIIEDLCTNSKITKGKCFDKRTNKHYHFCTLSTKSLNDLNVYYNDWYLNKKKIIPNNLKLDSLMMAIWFFDDGGIFLNNGRLRIEFYTNCFTLDEVSFLKNLLNSRYSGGFKIVNKKEDQYYIYGADGCAIDFAEDIKDYFYFLPRKSNILENRLLQNLKPTRSFNKEKIYYLFDYLKDKKSFNILEIANKFDFKYNQDISSTLYALLRRLVKNGNLLKVDENYEIVDLSKEYFKYKKSFIRNNI